MKKIALAILLLAVPVFAHADATSTPDTTPPVITAPIDQSFATTTFPAFPTLIPATATDDADPNPTIAYSPMSFPLGTTTVLWTATDASGNFATTTSRVEITDATPAALADTARIELRDGATLLGPFTVELPATSTPSIAIAPTGGGGPYSVPARSVLAILETLDATTSDFDITDLQYFSSFSSFLINCISIPAATSSPLCSDWQYVVNGAAPAVGVDKTALNDNDVVILYFGFPRQVALSASSVESGQPFTATAQTYDPASNSFSPATGVTVGVTEPNPADPYSPLEIATSSVDADGQAIFTLSATGTYQVGIQEDYYFPTSDITITEPAPTPPSTPAPAPSGGGNGPPVGGGGAGMLPPQFDVGAALKYLASQQRADGAFDSPLLSDWAALAFAASDPGAAKTKLKNYLQTTTPVLSSATDYERHAMALEALGIDPRAGAAADYIAAITAAFDGTQIGDASLDNDDIFALFPLLHAGYGTSDAVIAKTVVFIVARQKSDGSWDESTDLTAAGIQALEQVASLPGVSSAIGKAENYLHVHQQLDGGLGDGGQSSSFSTAWVLQAIAALGEAPSQWNTAGNHTPLEYLASAQRSDGGVEPAATDAQTRTWTSEYAVPAALGKTWSSLLTSFQKPVGSGGAGAAASATETAAVPVATSTDSTATSTPPVATTTEQVATSTPPVIAAATTTPTPIPPAAVTHGAVATHAAPPPPTAQPAAAPEPSNAGQPAAAAGASGGGSFLGIIWHAIVSFFSGLL